MSDRVQELQELQNDKEIKSRTMPDRKVVCAACRHSSGVVICSARHFDTRMHLTIKAMFLGGKIYEQGFIDQNGVFMNRGEALQVARKAGQIGEPKEVPVDDKLFSEDLY